MKRLTASYRYRLTPKLKLRENETPFRRLSSHRGVATECHPYNLRVALVARMELTAVRFALRPYHVSRAGHNAGSL
jgi:hypothetical protein